MKKKTPPFLPFFKSSILVGLTACLTFPQVVSAAPYGPVQDRADNNPGAQLNRAREYMERQRVLRQIQEDQESRKEKVQGTVGKPFQQEAAEVTFDLKKVDVATSAVLSQEELDRLITPYLNRKVTLNDLYSLVEDINRLYAEKGYATCRAILPPQRIHEGVVQVKLIEGKTGTVTIQGNEHTRESYIQDRVPLNQGSVANIQELNQSLRRFNGSNDAQMRIMMKAGEEPGTTDYEIQLVEPPKNQTISLYIDNAGYENNGRWRAGLLYNNRSLTGHRDHLNLNYLHSEAGGSDVFGAAYSLPINTYGTRLDVNYGANSTEIVDGWMSKLGVKGHASSYGLALRHPLIVDENIRVETGLEYQHQESTTSLFVKTSNRQKWIDDRTTRVIPYVSFTHYGDSTVLYHRHGINFGHYKNIDGDTRDYEIYNLDSLFYWRFGEGQMLQARLTGQEAFSNYLSSSEKFYLGGVSSVRGYEESLISGDSGVSGSLEYSYPLSSMMTGLSTYAFIDAGTVWGDSAYGDKTLVGAGFGFRYSFKDWLNLDIGMGVPLKRTINDDEQDKARLHFMLSATY